MYFQSPACNLLLVFLPQLALSWPSGAPAGACGTLSPNHGASEQNSISPYMIKAEKLGGGVVQLMIKGNSGANPFRGFMIQAKDKSGRAIGRFDLDSESRGKYLQCEDGFRDTITHNSRDAKDSVTFKWMAPEDYSDMVHFEGSFVEAKVKYWTDVKSEMLNLDDGSSSGVAASAAPAGASAAIACIMATVYKWVMH